MMSCAAKKPSHPQCETSIASTDGMKESKGPGETLCLVSHKKGSILLRTLTAAYTDGTEKPTVEI